MTLLLLIFIASAISAPAQIDIERSVIRHLINKEYIEKDFIYQWELLRRKQTTLNLSNDERYKIMINTVTMNRALKKFQQDNALIDTGVIDKRILNVLFGNKYENMSINDDGLYDLARRNRRDVGYFSTTNYKFPKLDDVRWMYVQSRTPIAQNRTLNIRTAIHDALTEWKTALNITFSETSNIHEADIKVSFHNRSHGDNFPFDGKGGIMAHAYYPYGDNVGVIHLDIDEDWDYKTLYCVILHEIGHTFGISHSSVKDAVMYEWYFENKNLHDDDKHAINSLYGFKSKWGPWGPITTHKPTREYAKGVTSVMTESFYRGVINIFNSNVQIH
jgi:matrix metalloproteinase-16 (membrane-inserted)